MRYTKYTIHTTTEAEELVCYMLGELGITGIEIDNLIPVLDGDRQGGVFEELQPDMDADDGKSHISFYLEENEDATALLSDIKTELEDISAYANVGEATISTKLSDEADWRDNWKQYFSSFSIGDILIKPTWEEAPESLDDKILIEIDPGVSFGTGKHESTQLVIRQLQKYLQPHQKILDVGCGSGILSVIALKMGAGHVVGTDIDEDCITSSYENFDVNHLAHELGDFYVGNLIDDEELQQKVETDTYDLVLANILADIIIPMAPMLAAAVKPGGFVITSGIIDFKEAEVKKALVTAGLEIVETNAQGEWRNVTARKSM